MIHDNKINHDNKIKFHGKVNADHDKAISFSYIGFHMNYFNSAEFVIQIMITNKIHDKAFEVHDKENKIHDNKIDNVMIKF